MAGNDTIDTNVSTATSYWMKQSTEPEINELREHRKMLILDHKKLMAEYALVLEQDEEFRPAYTDEFDGFRRGWWKKVMDFVSLARERFDTGRLSEDQLRSMARFVNSHIRDLWNKTRYFAHDMPPSPIPTVEEIMEPLPNSGEKRPLNDFSLATDAFADMPQTARFRTSSPNPDSAMDAEVQEVNVGSNHHFLRPTAIPHRRQSVGNLPSRDLPNTPMLSTNVEKWLQKNNMGPTTSPIPTSAATETETPGLSQSRLHVRAALIKSREKEEAQQREIEELKQRLKARQTPPSKPPPPPSNRERKR